MKLFYISDRDDMSEFCNTVFSSITTILGLCLNGHFFHSSCKISVKSLYLKGWVWHLIWKPGHQAVSYGSKICPKLIIHDHWLHTNTNTVNNAIKLERLRLHFLWSRQVKAGQMGSEEVKGGHWGGWAIGGTHGGGPGTNQLRKSTRLLIKQSENQGQN